MKDSSSSERRVWELLKLRKIGRRGRSHYWTKPLELVENFLASSFKSRNEAWGGALAMGNPLTFSRLASPSGKERTCAHHAYHASYASHAYQAYQRVVYLALGTKYISSSHGKKTRSQLAMTRA